MQSNHSAAGVGLPQIAAGILKTVPDGVLPPELAAALASPKRGTLREAAEALLKKGHPEAADAVFRGLVECPDPPFWAWPGLARAAMAQENWPAAVEAWRTCLDRFPDRAVPAWYFGLARALRAMGEAPGAETVLDEMAEVFAGTLDALTRQATVAARREEWGEALRLWTLCIESHADALRPEWLNGRATALARLGQPEAAMMDWAETIRCFPDFVPGRLRMAETAREMGRWPVVRQCMDEQIARFPERVTAGWLAAKAKALMMEGAYDEAAGVAAALERKFPESPLGCRLAVELCFARQSGIDMLAVPLEAGLSRFPEDRLMLAEYCRILLASGRPIEAEMIARVLLKLGDDHIALIARWRVNMDRDGEGSLRDAAAAAIAERDWTPESAVAVAEFLLSLWSGWPVRLARQLLGTLLKVKTAPFRGRMAATCALARALVALHEDDQALQLIDSLPEASEALDVIELRAWAAWRRGEVAAAKQAWREMLAKRDFPAVNSPAPALTPVKSDSTVPGGVTAFVNVKNEMAHLPEFLRHYRALGVRRFVVVDNLSVDEGPAYLEAQPDVVLYRTGDSFHDSGAGLRWVNLLRDRHAACGWSLYADADEALIYPGWETVKLDALTEWLDREGAEAMGAYMLDVYPERLIDSTGAPVPQAAYEFYDADYEWLGLVRAPYVQPVGGMRGRLFGANEYLHKTPLFKVGAGIYVNSHNTTPVRVSAMFGALLHYKLFNIAARFRPARPGIGGNPFMAGRPPDLMRRHVRYAARLPDLLNADLRLAGVTATLADSLTLTARGVMRAPDDYLASLRG